MERFRAGSARLALMAAFVVLGAAPAMAQAPAAPEPPPRLEASAQLTFLDTRGNAPTQSLGAGGEITWRPGVWTHNAKALFAQNESEGVVDARSMTALFRSSRQLTPRVSGYLQYDYLRDTFAGVDQRHIGEAGVSFKAVETARQLLRLDAGLGYLSERGPGASLDSATLSTGALYRIAISETAEFKYEPRILVDAERHERLEIRSGGGAGRGDQLDVLAQGVAHRSLLRSAAGGFREDRHDHGGVAGRQDQTPVTVPSPAGDRERSRCEVTRLLGLPVADHFEPVQFLLYSVKGVVADLITGAHGEHRLPRRLERRRDEVRYVRRARESPAAASVSESQMCRELLTNGVRDWRLARARCWRVRHVSARSRAARSSRPTGSSSCRSSARKKRLERQPLDHQRAEHDGERGQHDQVAIRKAGGQRQRGGERNNAPHAGPRNDQAAANGGPQHRPRRMKPEPAVPPPDDGVERHVPREAHDDHGHAGPRRRRQDTGRAPQLPGSRESGESAGR